ncbi:MAG: GAF domain-containing protein [Elusimicrobia bacterium]|nr:GAF domain-containing protein [Elusimicrobiota bacterium]
MPAEFFQRHLDIIFFVYGLAFFTAGAAILTQRRFHTRFRLGRSIGLLAAFCIIHGLNEWCDLWGLVKGRSPALAAAGLVLLSVSFACLLEFGRRLLNTALGRLRLRGSLSWVLGALCAAALGAAPGDSSIWPRYLLGFPGGLLTAAGFLVYYERNEEALRPVQVRAPFLAAAAAFAAYTLLGGLVVPQAGLFPASALNTDSFLDCVGAPVQLFRMLCAAAAAWAVCAMLKIFDWEAHEALNETIRVQAAVNELLRLSLAPMPLEQKLRRMLERVFATSWFSVQKKGCVFVSDGHELRMLVRIGMSEALAKACGRLPMGRCLCGRAAATGQAVLTAGLDERHEVSYPGIAPHGHLCLPLKREAEVLGVLNLYLGPGQALDSRQQDFARAVADIFAGMLALDRAEAAVHGAQKMETIGILAGGVAHDFNNLLAGVLGNADLALMDLPREHPARESVSEIRKAAQQAAQLTGQLLAYAGRSPADMRPADLNALIRDMDSLLAMSTLRKVPIHYQLDAGLPPAPMDAAQVRQVVMNLVINAAESLGPSGASIRVETRFLQADREFLARAAAGAQAEAGPYLQIAVQDSGCGMDEATRSRIFEPFFSTKFTGRGLGLSSVLGMVRNHKGAILVDSEPGCGSRFRVLLPCPAQPAAAPASAAGALGRGSASI